MLSGSAPPDPSRIFRGLDLDKCTSVVVAVSGGGDSLALLFLLKTHLERLPNAPALLAVTVDHRLRPAAAVEAADVARLCAGHGIAHRTAVWEEAKPVSGLAAAAREARHGLLARVARDAGTDIVLTGHTRDDQAETVAMRSARGAGRGDAGIAPATLFDGRVWFVRPLLGQRRADLRAFLARRAIVWIDDPSNEDPRFERVRVRKALREEDVELLAGGADEAAGARSELAVRAARLIAEFAARPAPGLLHLSKAFAVSGDHDAAVYALRVLVAVAGGRDHLPDAVRAEALFAKFGAVPFRATLSRVLVTVRREGIFLYRETRNLPQVPAAAQAHVWDGRYRLDGLSGENFVVAPVGTDQARMAERVETPEKAVPASLLRAALAAEPALWRGTDCLGPARDIRGVSCRPVVAPWARYLPLFDLEPARATARLIGAREPPDPPCAGHIAW